QSLVHYAQLGLVANDPLAFGIEPGTAGEAAIFVWDLDPTAPIEDAPADVDRVVEDAFAERDVARQGRGVPDTGVVFALFPRTRRGHTLVVEDLADGLQAVAVGVELEDPQNQRRFVGADCKTVGLPPLRVQAKNLFLVPEDLSARRTAARRLPFQASARGIGDTHALLFADDPFEGECQVVDPPCGDCMHGHVVGGEQLAHERQVFLVAAEPVDVLYDQDFRLAGLERGEHGLKARSFHRGTGDAIITVKSNQMETVLLCVVTRKQLLIIHGGCSVLRIVEALSAIGNSTEVHLPNSLSSWGSQGGAPMHAAWAVLFLMKNPLSDD